MARLDLGGKLVVITGAASGIGLECARSFSRRGARLALIGQDENALNHAANELAARGAIVKAYTCNVADENAVARAAEAIQLELGPADVVVNNAGIGYLGSLLETAPHVWRRVLDVNVMGVVHCIRSFLPAMLAAGGTRSIVNVASAAGFIPTMRMGAYAASKHAVVGLSEVLAMELADTPVSVLIVAPSFVNTSIVNSPANVAACISSAQLARLQTYYRLKGLSPQAVAEMIVRAVEGRRQFVAIGLPAKLGLALMRISRRVGRRLAIHWSRKIGFA